MQTYYIDYVGKEDDKGYLSDPKLFSSCYIEAYSQCDAETEFSWEYKNEAIVNITQVPSYND